MTETKSIPNEILNAVVSILQPYSENINTDKIKSYLSECNQPPKEKNQKLYFTTKELVDYLGVSSNTLLRARQNGDLAVIKTNASKSGKVIYSLVEVEKWLNSKKKEAC